MKFAYGLVLFLIIWYFLALVINSSLILPTPLEVGRIFITLIFSKSIWNSIYYTLLKGFIALFFTLLLGFIFGFVMGICEKCFELLRPIFTISQSVPIISWLVLVIFIWGIGITGPIIITVLSLIPNVTFSVAHGVRNTDKKLLEMAQIYNVSKKKIIKDIYFGSVIPFLLSALEVVSGNLWKVIIVSEYLAGKEGIGVQISWARQYVNIPKVYALTIIAVILGISTERAIKFLTKKVILYDIKD
ncbi:ABC transporter permease [Thermosipho sp. 1074]|uniref:ABC transporter permease n=1 Tax=Thermosipho sp. 1074 TaxID=1643331 RepID=UPI000985FFC0|nr:ABC transporter permease subunit [Thermosipho sp. 1074]OOC43506.1 ABC transporter permease [Thermosipho sp. 1074]